MAYDPTLIFKLLDDLSLLGETLSPAILEWIKNRDGADKQNVLNHRMKRCIRHCRRAHFGAAEIAMQVDLDFRGAEFTDEERDKIKQLIGFQLLPHIVLN
jgi:macrodomain Ter protein organizer (MatP/YcbG family)